MRFASMHAATLLALAALAAGSALAISSCSGTTEMQPAGQPDGSTHDSGQPTCDADTNKDPKHCGSCTHSCSTGQLCDNGTCKNECTPPLIKCEGVPGCLDLTKDLEHCGGCNSVCTAPEGGIPSPEGGAGDSGGGDGAIGDSGAGDAGDDASDAAPSDAGDDGGPEDPGQRIATAACVNSSCTFTCPPDSTQCVPDSGAAQGCFLLKVNHDHCGDCNTMCQGGEDCMQGICCATGHQICNGSCTDTTQDLSNCGSCGHSCGNGAKCINGACAGYSIGSSAQAWVDACSLGGAQTVLANTSDDNTSLMNLPFPFVFYNKPVTQFWVGTDGQMGFGTPQGWQATCPLPDQFNPDQSIFILSDWTQTRNGICIGTQGTQPNRQLVVTWEDVDVEVNGNHDTYSVVLTETTNTIDFLYDQASGGTEAQGEFSSVGLQNDSTFGTNWQCGQIFLQQVPLAERFTPSK